VSRTARLWIILALLPLIAAPFISCDSSEDPVDPGEGGGGTEPTSVSGVIGPAGGTLTSSNGLLQIVIPAGAVTVDTRIGASEISPAAADTSFARQCAAGAMGDRRGAALRRWGRRRVHQPGRA
jgi:hypothetical protein